jgi:hypothetical protein
MKWGADSDGGLEEGKRKKRKEEDNLMEGGCVNSNEIDSY